MKVAQALAWAAGAGVDRREAAVLLLHALGREHDRAWLIAHDEDTVATDSLHRYHRLCRRRGRGEPLAYLTGQQAFYGLELHVDRRVLIPRPDTETLVDWALDLELPSRSRVIDVGTGSGALALALKHQRPGWTVGGLDASSAALTVARANAARLKLAITWRQGYWLEGIAGPFELIVSNPPYIAEGDPHLPALRHEPAEALTAGASGLDALLALISQAPSRLVPGGWLLLEHGHDQAAAVRRLLARAGFQKVQSRADLAGIERCSGGQRG
jgi:release factor glutamine methyltransferase